MLSLAMVLGRASSVAILAMSPLHAIAVLDRVYDRYSEKRCTPGNRGLPGRGAGGRGDPGPAQVLDRGASGGVGAGEQGAGQDRDLEHRLLLSPAPDHREPCAGQPQEGGHRLRSSHSTRHPLRDERVGRATFGGASLRWRTLPGWPWCGRSAAYSP